MHCGAADGVLKFRFLKTGHVGGPLLEPCACTQVITNWPEDKVEHVHAADFPGRGEAGYKVPCSRVCYIERTDFKVKDERGYYGLAPGKSIMLRCAPAA